MGEWNEPPVSPEFLAMMKAFQDAEKDAYAAWRRGDPPPARKALEARKPKHAYVGNRKQRRAQERAERKGTTHE